MVSIQKKQKQEEKCPICGELGTSFAVEKLPKSGTYMQFKHKSKKLRNHEWAKYDSLEALASKNKHKDTPPIKIDHCPVCNKKGRVNPYISHKNRPWLVTYMVVHEDKMKNKQWRRKDGTKIDAPERCPISRKNKNKAHYNEILNMTGNSIHENER